MSTSTAANRFSKMWAVIVSVTLLVGLSSGQDTAPKPTKQELDAKIAKLIEKLGAAEYATREKAKSELERLGLVAFDALHDAQHHDDIEVAMRARHLVRSMRVNWATENDPPEVKRILRGYGSQSEDQRQTRMDRLADLEDSRGVGALCRLVRFESSRRLSKRAALMVMSHKVSEDKTERVKLTKMINETVGLSKRPGARWIKAYGKTLLDSESALDLWEQLSKEEHETFTQIPERSSRDIVLDLLRWQAEMLRDLKREVEAVAVMRRTIDLLDGTTKQILDMVDWLMERKAWSVVAEVADRYSERFNEEPLLLYRLAESHVQQGQRDKAEATATRARNLITDEPSAHVVAAFSLQERGLLEWAEREYRHVIKLGPAGSDHELRSRLLLSEMLHDLEKELPAAKVLQGAVDICEKDPAAAEVLRNRLGRELGSVKSRMYYFYSRQDVTAGDRKKQVERLEEAVKADPTDADVLIAMHRVPDATEEWKRKTLQQLDRAKGHFRDKIAEWTRQSAEAPSEPIREYANRQLASMNNQFAWLVGNTVGDYDEAIRCSKRSLELRPDTGGYLDTLGRCYYAKGDLENAVKHQTRAAELEPHSEQIQRQLDFFKKELAERKKKSPENKDGDQPKAEPNKQSD